MSKHTTASPKTGIRRRARVVRRNGSARRKDPTARRTTPAQKSTGQDRADQRGPVSRGDVKRAKKLAKAQRTGENGKITPGNTKRVIGIAKIAGPVLLPFAARAASVARDRYDRFRARRLGVPVQQLPSFTGHGAALHARIASDADALRELRGLHPDGERPQPDVEQYADRSAGRLAQLSSAVRAAERMPAARRRATHRGVRRELASLERELLERFGMRGG